MSQTLFTIGHSNHTLPRFMDLLQRHEIQTLADIRRFPGSRKFPHFGQQMLTETLQAQGMRYRWLEALGGRRPTSPTTPSPNGGLRNKSFRNYADYMLTAAFRDGIAQLAEISATSRTAIMCSESVFWRCHRRLVSDYVVSRGWTVLHIFPAGEAKPHTLTAEAVVTPDGVIYPDDASSAPAERPR